MSERELVIEDVKRRMTNAFERDALIDGQNLERWLSSLEAMTDAEYLTIGAGVEEGAIS